MPNIPEVDFSEVYKTVITKLSNEKADLTIQVASLEQIANKLVTERDEAVARAVSAEESLKDEIPSEQDSE